MSINPEEFRLPDGDGAAPVMPATTSRAGRMSRSTVPFARVPLPWLMNARWHGLLSARVRLYLLLWIKSREGRRLVTLTNDMAGSIGLDRAQKMRCLRQLEDCAWSPSCSGASPIRSSA